MINQKFITIKMDDALCSSVKHNFVPPSLKRDNITFYDLDTLCYNHNISKITLRRRLKLVENKNCSLYFIKLINRYYVTNNILHLNVKEVSKLNTLKGNWAIFLQAFDWDYYATVRFFNSYSLETVRNRANSFFTKLASKYYGLPLRMFYAIQQNPGEDGFHFHFLLWVDTQSSMKSELKRFTENHFRGKTNSYANTHMEKYNPELGAVGYILRQSHLFEDSMDFLTMNLTVDPLMFL
jgi:hypothetical protein